MYGFKTSNTRGREMMEFKIESVVGCRKLWVVMYSEDGERVDALPCLRMVLGLGRRIDRKKRRLVRTHNKLVALGFRK